MLHAAVLLPGISASRVGATPPCRAASGSAVLGCPGMAPPPLTAACLGAAAVAACLGRATWSGS